MRAMIKEQPVSEPEVLAVKQGWSALLLEPLEDDAVDIKGDLSALRSAEAVIRAQEKRIKILESLATTDELTGLSNRRGFLASFRHELALARRDADFEGMMVSIDLDGFKSINDRWGHQKGDAYLYAVGEFLRSSLRESDTVARLGGDEFAVLLTRVDEATGKRRLAKLEKAFARKTVLVESLRIRASFGYAVYTGASNAEAVMKAADMRLYAEKAAAKKVIAVD